jgi:hypothetical protein
MSLFVYLCADVAKAVVNKTACALAQIKVEEPN